jgi:hypothetical protein
MEKTAMQLMIQKVEQHTQLDDSKIWWEDFKLEMLTKEREQIINASNHAYETFNLGKLENKCSSESFGEKYFNQKFSK